MFVLVNHSDDFGLTHCENFDTHKEAYEYIAGSMIDYYDFEEFDFMEAYPFENDIDYSKDDVWLSAGYNWLSCGTKKYTDRWLIIEV